MRFHLAPCNNSSSLFAARCQNFVRTAVQRAAAAAVQRAAASAAAAAAAAVQRAATAAAAEQRAEAAAAAVQRAASADQRANDGLEPPIHSSYKIATPLIAAKTFSSFVVL